MSWLSDHLPPGPVVLDASAIINLLGCGEMQEVLVALGVPALVEERTLDEIRRHPVPGQDHRASLDGMQRQGLLTVERMTEEEYEIYLGLVAGVVTSRLGIGESAAIALAGRGHTVILDDNKARSVLSRDFGQLAFVSTLRTMLTAAHRGGWPVQRVQSQLTSARRHARMGVPREEMAELAELMDGVSGYP